MTLNVSQELRDKLAEAGDEPILDSAFVTNSDGTKAEKVQGTKGLYISSETDGWQLRGPFGPAD